MVAESLSKESTPDVETVVLNTMLEHNSNELPWRHTPGISLIRLSADAEGFLNLQELEALLSDYNHKGKYGKKRIRLVAVSGASNVLGVYNDLQQTGEIVHRFGARLLVDAAQLVAHRKIAMEKCKIDYLAFSAHKVYAPFGTGVLIACKGTLSFSDEEMKLILSSGEENPGGIAALGKALVLLERVGMDIIREEEQQLTRHLTIGLKQIPGLEIYGLTEVTSPRFDHKGGVVVFNLKNFMANKLARRLSEQGIGVRYGCHCAHILVKQLLKISPFLEGFQHQIFSLFPKLTPPGVTRVSLGLQNSKKDVDRLIEVLQNISSKTEIPNASGHLPDGDFQRNMEDYLKSASESVYNSSL
jgi:selenocysteine lyase/cysteine desulfurase